MSPEVLETTTLGKIQNACTADTLTIKSVTVLLQKYAKDLK
jgi:hypothetical protein